MLDYFYLLYKDKGKAVLNKIIFCFRFSFNNLSKLRLNQLKARQDGTTTIDSSGYIAVPSTSSL